MDDTVVGHDVRDHKVCDFVSAVSDCDAVRCCDAQTLGLEDRLVIVRTGRKHVGLQHAVVHMVEQHVG